MKKIDNDNTMALNTHGEPQQNNVEEQQQQQQQPEKDQQRIDEQQQQQQPQQPQESQPKKTVDFFPDSHHTFDDLDTSFNMDNLEKKKKKKKKPFDMEEIEMSLPVEDTPPPASNGPIFEIEKEEIDLDMDFSMAKKKRKSKKKDIDEFLGEKKEDDDMLKADDRDTG